MTNCELAGPLLAIASATGYIRCMGDELPPPHHRPVMARALCPLYYVEVDGKAATKQQTASSCMRQFDRKFTGHTGIMAFLVQVDPNTDKEVCRTRIYTES